MEVWSPYHGSSQEAGGNYRRNGTETSWGNKNLARLLKIMVDMLQIEKSEEKCMSLNTQCEMVIEPASPYIFLTTECIC